MTLNIKTRPTLLKAISSIALPLAVVGCQHEQHYATTQVVVQISPNQTAVAEVAAPAPAANPPAAAPEAPAPAAPQMAAPEPATTEPIVTAPAATEPAVAPTTQDLASSQPAPEMEEAPRATGHGMGEMSRSAGHGVAQGMRETGDLAVNLTKDSVQRVKNSPPESLTAPEIDVDAAMQARDWDQVTATYHSGSTVAGPIGFLFEAKRDRPLWQQGVTEIPTFLVDSALLPYAFCKTPPWKPILYKGATIEPTYTGVPPLPPE